MNISIVIPTLNEERFVGALLASIDEQDFAGDVEVIVADASPTENTRRVASRFVSRLDLKILGCERPDIGSQRNEGATVARFDTLLFLDADVVLGPGVLNACSEMASRNPRFVASVRHVPDRSSPSIKAGMLLINTLIRLSRAVGIPVTNGDFILTDRVTFQHVNGFRSGYLLGEDTDFGVRVRRAGINNFMIWDKYITASSRRLDSMPIHHMLGQWIFAYLRALSGRGPTGDRRDDARYRYGIWK